MPAKICFILNSSPVEIISHQFNVKIIRKLMADKGCFKIKPVLTGDETNLTGIENQSPLIKTLYFAFRYFIDSTLNFKGKINQ